MKIYLFDSATGIYHGEDFADESGTRGEFVIPPDATTIEPPKVGQGEIPIYNMLEKRWEVQPLISRAGNERVHRVMEGDHEAD